MRPRPRSPARKAARLLVLPVLLLLAYPLAAIVFALFPVSGRPQQMTGGEPVLYVCASLAHTDILLPSHDPLIDWQALFPAAVPPGLPPETYLAIGWGDLVFFRETPTWADVKIPVALGALLGLHDTALRVIPIMPPVGDSDCRRLEVDRAGRQALIDRILASLKRDAAGRPLEQPGSRWPVAYYLSEGRYGFFHTCNQWVASALAAAGLPHARFAPFSFSVTWPLSGN